MKLKGFTIAEIFATMLIIAVLAILFWQVVYPVFAQSAATSKIKKFNSLIKQVQIKAQTNTNDWYDYYIEPDSIPVDVFIDRYFLPYVTYLKKDTDEDGNTKIYLNDSSSFSITKNETKCLDFALDINNNKLPNEDGRDRFHFIYCPKSDNVYMQQGDIVPCRTKEMITREAAKNSCKTKPETCTGFISFDEYNFEEDYPFKIPF